MARQSSLYATLRAKLYFDGLPSRSPLAGVVPARLRTLCYGAAAFVLATLRAKAGGAEGDRTPDPHNAIVVLYQLSYDPIRNGTQSKLPQPHVKTFRRHGP